MLYVRLLLLAAILTLISWVVLKLIRKPIHIGLVFIFWIAAIVVTMTSLYVISVLLASS